MKLRFVFSMIIMCMMVRFLYASAPDTVWMYTDRIDPLTLLYYEFTLCDTLRAKDTNCVYNDQKLCDTGDVYDSSYINFDYQFTDGYAGFKIDWDRGVTAWNFAGYDYLGFTYKGPLSNHKVTIRFGWNSGCGSPTTFQTIGEFPSASEWTTYQIPIPETAHDTGNYEMQVLINNVEGETSPTSEPGNLKLDDIMLTSVPMAAVSYRKPALMRNISRRFFTPRRSGMVSVSGYSLSGEQLFNAQVEVEGQTRYAIQPFIEKHIQPLSSQVSCIRIKGAGVDMLQRMCR